MRTGLFLLVTAFMGALASADDDRVPVRVADMALQKQIHDAMDRGVASLKSMQHPTGHWGAPGDDKDLLKVGDLSHPGGYTALALYALAASGAPAGDPAIVRGLAWLERYGEAFLGDRAAATYANSLLVLALTRIDPKAHRDLIHRTAAKIERGERSSGFWSYPLGSATDSTPRDYSNPDRREFNKGAVTPHDEPHATAAVTQQESFPDVTNARGLARAFDQYAEFKPEQRAVVLVEFGKAGPAAIGCFIERLKDPRVSVRRAALELLTKLLAKPMLFDADAAPEERAVMIVPIEGFFEERGQQLIWNAERRRFELP